MDLSKISVLVKAEIVIPRTNSTKWDFPEIQKTPTLRMCMNDY